MISYDEALALLKEYNEGEFHLKHACNGVQREHYKN